MPFTVAIRLFALLNLRFMARRRLQTFLCVAGIAIGVGVVVAIDLANQGALASFRRAVDTVTGKTTHQITASGAADFDENVFIAVRGIPGVAAAAPVIEQNVAIVQTRRETIRVMGTDPFLDAPFRGFGGSGTKSEGGGAASETTGPESSDYLLKPGRLVLSGRVAARHGLRAGDGLTLLVGAENRAATVHAVFNDKDLGEGSGNLAVMDIAGAQELFGKVGRLDRIDLKLTDGADEETVRRALPGGVELTRPEQRTARVEEMVKSFRMNLMALSLLAVFVGVFLIHNTLTFAVIQRRRQIGIMRGLGLSRAQVAGLFLAEAALLGVVGSLAGLALGLALTTYTLRAVSRTVSTLFEALPEGGTGVGLPWTTLAGAFAVGMGASLLAALAPAVEAAGVPPGAAVAGRRLDDRLRRAAPRLAGAGALVLAVTLALAFLPTRSVAPGYAGAFGIMLGFALLGPAVAIGATGALAAMLDRLAPGSSGAVAKLGARNVTASLSRTAPAIAALMVALAMMIGVSLMVRSFRATLTSWIGQTIRADVFIQPGGQPAQRDQAFLPPELLAELAADEDTEEVDGLRRLRVEAAGRPTNLNAIRFDLASVRARNRFLTPESAPAIAELREGADVVLASDTLASFTGLKAGDTLSLKTPDGPRDFRVGAIYKDFSADGGQLLMDRRAFARHWHDDRTNNAAVYLKPGADADAAAVRMREALSGRYEVVVRSNRTLRTEVLRIFDDTFAITYVMQALSTGVAFCGILSALLALLMERTRELATLRAIGMTRRQLSGLMYAEAGTMGLIASLLGAAAGTALAALLVFVINARSFGWTIEFLVFPDVYASATAVAVGSALAATIYPAWRLGRMALAAAMREE